jgi:hypothetical protein
LRGRGYRQARCTSRTPGHAMVITFDVRRGALVFGTVKVTGAHLDDAGLSPQFLLSRTARRHGKALGARRPGCATRIAAATPSWWNRSVVAPTGGAAREHHRAGDEGRARWCGPGVQGGQPPRDVRGAQLAPGRPLGSEVADPPHRAEYRNRGYDQVAVRFRR